MSTPLPYTPPFACSPIEVSAGNYFSLALLANGQVTGWGDDAYSQRLGGSALTGVSSISASDVGLALLLNGRVTGWGDNQYNVALGGIGITGISGISASQIFSLALLRNGRVTGWGDNTFGQISDGKNLSNVTSVSAGYDFSLAILSGGRITGWGDDTFGQSTSGNGITGARSVSAGFTFGLAILSDGRVTGWGDNAYNQSFGANGVTGAVQLAAGQDFGLALISNGTVTGWGNNDNNQSLGCTGLTGVVSVSAGNNYGVALLSNGRITGWGNNDSNQSLGAATLTGQCINLPIPQPPLPPPVVTGSFWYNIPDNSCATLQIRSTVDIPSGLSWDDGFSLKISSGLRSYYQCPEEYELATTPIPVSSGIPFFSAGRNILSYNWEAGGYGNTAPPVLINNDAGMQYPFFRIANPGCSPNMLGFASIPVSTAAARMVLRTDFRMFNNSTQGVPSDGLWMSLLDTSYHNKEGFFNNNTLSLVNILHGGAGLPAGLSAYLPLSFRLDGLMSDGGRYVQFWYRDRENNNVLIGRMVPPFNYIDGSSHQLETDYSISGNSLTLNVSFVQYVNSSVANDATNPSTSYSAATPVEYTQTFTVSSPYIYRFNPRIVYTASQGAYNGTRDVGNINYGYSLYKQTIFAFDTITDKPRNNPPFSIAAPASTSRLPVELTIKSGPATISGTPGGNYVITLTGDLGTVVVAANQAGNSDFDAAPEITTSFDAGRMLQTISPIPNISEKIPNQVFTLNAPASSSGLPVTLSIKSGLATIVSIGSGVYRVTIGNSAGTVTLAANQEGDENYLPAAEITRSFTVRQLSQFISPIPRIGSKPSTSAPFTLTAPVASSGLPVTLSIKSGPATIDGTAGGTYTVTLNGETGVVVIAANQSGNAVYAPAVEVSIFFHTTLVIPVQARISLQKNEEFITPNTSWVEDYDNFTGYGFFAPVETAGVLINNFSKQNDKYLLNYGIQTTGAPSGVTGIYRSSVSLKGRKKDTVFPYQKIDSRDYAWASYELHSGLGMPQNSQNVSSYSIEFVKNIGFNYPLILTGQKTGYKTIEINTPPPYLLSTTGNLLNQLVCLSRVDCEFEQPKVPVIKPNPFSRFLDKKACWTGKSTTGQDYQLFEANFLKGTLSGIDWRDLLRFPPRFSSGTINQLLITASAAPGTSGFFDYISGNIICNPFVTGDSIKFDLYNYDYTGAYRSYHGSYPIYPSTGFTLNYPQDFTGYQDLTDVLNSRLNSASYPVWYPYAALAGTPIGVYVTGSLMSFELKNTGSSNPYISYVSNRNYTSGFNISLTTGARGKIKVLDVSSFESEVNRVSGYSYLLPNQIDLQGYDINSSSWIVLDRQTNLFNSLTGLEPTVLKSTGYSGWFDSGVKVYIPPAISGAITGVQPIIDNISIFENVPGFETLYTGNQTAYAQKNIYCPPISDTRGISIVRPTGWPTGIDGCTYTGSSGEKECSYCCQWAAENNISGLVLFTDDALTTTQACSSPGKGFVPYVILNQGTCWVCTGVGLPADSGIKPFESKQYFLRTGWNLNPTGRYLNCLLSGKQYDITQLNFSKYRITMTGFSGTTIYNDQDSYYVQQNSFIFKNINLYSAVNTFTAPILTGLQKKQSPIGLPYTLQVQGISELPFNYNYNYNISGQSNSGVHLAVNEAAYYLPTGSEINISFNKSSGKFVGQITGFVSGIFTGSGIVSNTFDDYYFYNPENDQVTFSKTLSGYAFGGTILSGQEIALTQTTINQSIVVGGSLSNQGYYTDFYTGAINVTGTIVGVPYQQDNVSGFYILTGSVTGTTTSGYLNYQFPISGQYTGDQNNPAYYYLPTGFVRASALVRFDFNALNNYNYLAINSNAITYYNPVTSEYFENISGLLSIINSSPLTYQVSGADLSDPSFSGEYSGVTGIMLYSLLSGSSGNFITLESDTTSGIIVPSGEQLTGGRDLYSRLFNPLVDVTGDPILFNGVAAGTLYQTGFYSSVLPTGTIYGPITTYQFTRRFEDIWALSTGLPSNLSQYTVANNLVAPGRYLGVVTGNSDLGQYDNLVNLNLNYYNQYDIPTGVSTDIIDLYVTGYNFPSGTGIMFRITGVN